MLQSINLQEPTNAEILWTWRRRAGVSLTQPEAAERLGVPRKLHWKMENGKVEFWLHPNIRRYRNCMSLSDKCALARRRVQFFFGHKELARRFGISHVTLIEWERTGDHRLVEAWKKEGFQF